jgi:hypothetical protein
MLYLIFNLVLNLYMYHTKLFDNFEKFFTFILKLILSFNQTSHILLSDK